MSVGNKKYGLDQPTGIEYAPGVTNVNFDDPDLYASLKDSSDPQGEKIKRFLEALGLCHTVICDEKLDKETDEPYTIFNASSPDELALVNGARHLGFVFKARDDEGQMVCETAWDGTPQSYKLLKVIEFDSTRKRMSVIVRTPDERILVLCKGADSVIEKRLKKDDADIEETKEFLNEFAKTGLRTLLIASKEITEEEYQDFAAQYLEA